MSTTEAPGVIPGHSQPSVSLQKGRPTRSRLSAASSTEKFRLTDDRRRFQRVNVPLLGRYMRENKDEYPCQVVNVSSGGIALRASIIGEVGERIVVYLDTFGRIEGKIVRTYHEGFALQLSGSSYKREKIANQLTWLVNKDRLPLKESRRYDRFVPKKTNAKITMANGVSFDCEILDISLGGAAVVVEPKPEVGELVTLGLTPGRVLRHGARSISIEFLEIQDPASLERQFG